MNSDLEQRLHPNFRVKIYEGNDLRIEGYGRALYYHGNDAVEKGFDYGTIKNDYEYSLRLFKSR